MNCKQGDLAVVVSSACVENIGKVVRCLRLASQQEKHDAMFFTFMNEPFWVVDVNLKTMRILDKQPHGYVALARDLALRPIRDSDGQDETLTWQPVPTKETV